ncbi:MAG: flagellar hook-basal body protein [Defluviitaleaceae bacterium]|nr:flagellar hook-basal body protein [Defluviitaleaceae bacterium]
MIRGLYTSAMGMAVQMSSLDVVANNLANANTNGFRNATAVQQSFPDMLMLSLNSVPNNPIHRVHPVGGTGHGVVVSNISVNFAQGPFENTGGDLDVALSGDGFFSVETILPSGEAVQMFTRNGAFTVNTDRHLINFNGDRILNTDGTPILLPDGEIVIEANGVIRVNGDILTTLGIVNFEDPSLLRQHGYNLFAQNNAEIIPFTGSVEQGYLERSNVNVVREMVQMINISRAYELNQRMVGIADQTLGQAVNEIARR